MQSKKYKRLSQPSKGDCQLILKLVKDAAYNSPLSLNIDFGHAFYKQGDHSDAQTRFSFAFNYLITHQVIERDNNGVYFINKCRYDEFVNQVLAKFS